MLRLVLFGLLAAAVVGKNVGYTKQLRHVKDIQHNRDAKRHMSPVEQVWVLQNEIIIKK